MIQILVISLTLKEKINKIIKDTLILQQICLLCISVLLNLQDIICYYISSYLKYIE